MTEIRSDKLQLLKRNLIVQVVLFIIISIAFFILYRHLLMQKQAYIINKFEDITPNILNDTKNNTFITIQGVIAVGGRHTLYVKDDGSLWAGGWNLYGQVGIGLRTNHPFPRRIEIMTHWEKVSAGGNHSVGIRSDGTLWVGGDNYYGQLGIGDLTDISFPIQVDTDNDWVRISTGYNHTLAIKKDGSLWAWGDNSSGQLGVGDMYKRKTPTHVGKENDWEIVSVGLYHTLAIKKDGSLWAWGDNASGQLGTNDLQSNYNLPRMIDKNNWSIVSAGEFNSLGIKTDGSLWAWGDNSDGQLGLGDRGDGTNRTLPTRVGIDRWKIITAGERHSLGIKTDGSLWAWGDNSSGQLGLGDSRDRTNQALSTQVGIDTDWDVIVTGSKHTIGIKTDGTLFGCGNNDFDQLGNGGGIFKILSKIYVPATDSGDGKDKK